MKHLTNQQKRAIRTTEFKPGILADSLEVMEAYSMQKISLLQERVNDLPIGENTREIIQLCQQIKKERVLLQHIRERKDDATNKRHF